MSMSTLGPTGEAVGDLPMVGEKVTMTLANPDKDAIVAAARRMEDEGEFTSIRFDDQDTAADGSSVTNSSILTSVADLESSSPGPKIMAKKNDRRRQRCMIIAAILLVLFSLALIIGLSVGLTRASEKRAPSGVVSQSTQRAATPGIDDTPLESSASTNGTTTNDTTATPDTEITTNNVDRRQDAVDFLVESNIAPASVLNNATTPQARALESILQSPTSIVTIPSTSEEERTLFVERYAALVFFHSTGGTDSWAFHWNVGDADKPTCAWHAVVRVGPGRLLPGGFFCGPDRTRIVGLQFLLTNLTGTLPTELGLLNQLADVRLIRNNVGGSIPSELQNSVRMQNFIVDYNRMSGAIPSWIGRWSSLKILALSNNMFERSIPSEIQSLQNLTTLALDDNLFTGTLEPIASLSQLRLLYLEDNHFEGTLEPLESLNQLQVLDASNNKLKGPIPLSFFSHPELEVLDLHGNMLNGSLPTDIPPNDMLRLLALQRNSGLMNEIPSSITNLGALTHLDLTSTSFSGDMPTFFGDLTELRYLFLADTLFNQGPIPDEYRNLNLLRDLSLKDSNRTGTIPTWIGNLDRMILLDLDANRLNGTIPTEIGDMQALRLLLLNRNELRGSIPTELSRLRIVLALFDHNRLTGDATEACSGISPRRSLVSSDCNATASGPNDFVVTCPCCRLCCVSSDDTCNDFDHLGELDPIWEDNYQRRRGYTGRDFNITR